MNFTELKKADHDYVAQTYGRFDLGLDHGSGASCYDVDGKH